MQEKNHTYSFFKNPHKTNSTHQLISCLNSTNENELPAISNNHLEIIGDNHGNSYLLYAIAWGFDLAAIRIIHHNKNKGIDHKDNMRASQSTALILAAKTGSTAIALELLQFGANPNLCDHLGYSALHYACLLRDNALITALLKVGAETNQINKYGKLALDYYCYEFNDSDLDYFYGLDSSQANCLSYIWDTSPMYQGTKNKDLSAFRWFLQNIIINNDLGHSVKIGKLSNGTFLNMLNHFQGLRLTSRNLRFDLNEWLKYHLENEQAVVDSRIYSSMTQLLIAYRNELKIDNSIMERLQHNSRVFDPVFLV